MTGHARHERDYDALLVVSFGGPEGPDDVLPFLDNVFQGLRVSAETKAHIAKRYERFGGISPINDATRAFIKALQHELDARGPALPIYWGNRNWHPFLKDTLAQMAHAGIGRALAYVTSTFSSYSGCRKYREDLYAAAAAVPDAPVIDKLRIPYNHPGFVGAVAERVREALAALGADGANAGPDGAGAGGLPALVFTAHSLPESMARGSRYVAQLEESCRLVAEALGRTPWQLAYQSNNAQYGGEPWLGPDIGDALRALAAEGCKSVVVMPIGFVADHLEVVLDLDVEAAQAASELGLKMQRAATVGAHPLYVAMVRDLVLERLAGAPRQVLGRQGPMHDVCPADCCLSGRPGPVKPALCGVDSPPLRSPAASPPPPSHSPSA